MHVCVFYVRYISIGSVLVFFLFEFCVGIVTATPDVVTAEEFSSRIRTSLTPPQQGVDRVKTRWATQEI